MWLGSSRYQGTKNDAWILSAVIASQWPEKGDIPVWRPSLKCFTAIMVIPLTRLGTGLVPTAETHAIHEHACGARTGPWV